MMTDQEQPEREARRVKLLGAASCVALVVVVYRLGQLQPSVSTAGRVLRAHR